MGSKSANLLKRGAEWRPVFFCIADSATRTSAKPWTFCNSHARGLSVPDDSNQARSLRDVEADDDGRLVVLAKGVRMAGANSEHNDRSEDIPAAVERRFDALDRALIDHFGGMRDFVITGLRGVRQEMQTGFQEVRQEMSTGLQAARRETNGGLEEVHERTNAGFQGLRQELDRINVKLDRVLATRPARSRAKRRR